MEAEVSDVRKALYRGDRTGAEALASGQHLNVFDAAALGDIARLRACIAADPTSVAAWSADGFTALHFAAYLGGGTAVRTLLAAGADASAVARNDMRVQPLHSAAALGDLEACRALLEAGADPNAEQQGGFRPLDEALITENAPLVAMLREHGAQVSANTPEP
jgi:ankyrin repeat protein